MEIAGAVSIWTRETGIGLLMSKRKFQKSESATLLWLGGMASVCAIVLSNLAETAAFLFIISCCVGGFLYLGKKHQQQQEHDLCVRLQNSFERHEKNLISYFNQSRRRDLFGNIDDRRWQEHVDNFLRSQVVPEVADYKAWRKTDVGVRTARIIDNLTAKSADHSKRHDALTRVVAADLTPQQYEEYCADLIRARGWHAIVTQAGKDGGADVIAEFGNLRLVVQCKRYTQPAGNKAVQEVNSAVRLNGGNIACVVASSGFTKQAQMEAHGLGIYLCHHSDLSEFVDKMMSENARAPSLDLEARVSGT